MTDILTQTGTFFVSEWTWGAGYDEEARYFEAVVRADKRQDLVASAFAAVAEVRSAQLVALQALILQRFIAAMAAAKQAHPNSFSASAARCSPVPPSECEAVHASAAQIRGSS